MLYSIVATVFVALVGTVVAAPPQGPQIKLAVRHLTGVNAVAKEHQGVEITSPEDFAKRFGDKALQAIKEQVDFTKEKVVWFTWTGSGSETLDFTTTECRGQLKVMAYVFTPQPATADNRMHGEFLVLPKEARWTFNAALQKNAE